MNRLNKGFGILLSALLLLMACTTHETSHKPEYTAPIDSGQAANEIKQWSKAIEEHPEQAELYYNRALNYQQLGYLNRAEADFDEALKRDSTNAYYWYMAGRLAFSKNETIRAADLYNRSIALDSSIGEAQLKLAELYYIVKKHADSQRLLVQLIKKDPHNGYYFQLRGMNFKESGDTAAAIRNFQGAIERNEKDIDSYLYLARIMMAMHNSAALEYFNGALRIQPGNKDALYGRAVYFQETGRFPEAMKEYRRIISMDAVHYESYYNVGLINFKLGHFDEALRHFNTCVQIQNEYLPAYYMRGLTLEILHKSKEALANYEFILARNPEDAAALEAKKRLNK